MKTIWKVWLTWSALLAVAALGLARPFSEHGMMLFSLVVIGPQSPQGRPEIRAELGCDDEARAIVFFSDSGAIAVDDSSRIHVVDSGHEIWAVGYRALQDTGAFVIRGRTVVDSARGMAEMGWELRGCLPIRTDTLIFSKPLYEQYRMAGRLWRPKGYDRGWVPVGADEKIMDSDIDQRPKVVSSIVLPASSVPSGQRVESLVSGTACLDTTGRVVLFSVDGARDTTLGVAVRDWLNGHWTFSPARSRGRAVSDCMRVQVPIQ